MSEWGSQTELLDLTTGVVVAGGGPAGAWAALKAAQAGADVVLVDKGYFGTSGAAAAAGNNIWYVPPDPAQRDEAMRNHAVMRGGLTDPRWMARVDSETPVFRI